MSIGLKIKALRREKNLTADQLAKEIGASRQIIYEYESGRVIPGPTKIKRLSEVFGIQSSELQQLAVENEKGKNQSDENLTWYKNLLDEMREEKRRLQDQVDRLTRMLENQLGKPFDVTLGGLAIRDNYLEAKIVSMESQEVANSVTSLAERA